jgi:hypothetical protein
MTKVPRDELEIVARRRRGDLEIGIGEPLARAPELCREIAKDSRRVDVEGEDDERRQHAVDDVAQMALAVLGRGGAPFGLRAASTA